MTDPAWPSGDGEMARRIRAHGWASTPLGAFGSWPQSLKTAVDVMLGSGHAMQLAWGPERTVLYNDAYAPMLGNRHPGALGLPFPEAWPDIWEEIEPLVERVFAGGTVRYEDMPLVMTRSGYPEDTWWDFSYSPVRDESGAVAGLLNVTVDATGRIRAARAEAALRESEERQSFLLGLSDALRPLADPVEIQRTATRMLGEHLKASRVFYVVVEGDGDTAAILGDYTDGVPSRVGRYSLSAFSTNAVGEWRAGRTASSSDVDVDPRYSEAEREAYASVSTRAGFGVPLIKEGRLVALLGVNQSSPRHWTGYDTDLAGEVAERTWAAVERARAEAALRESEARQAFLLRLSDALRPVADPLQGQRVAMRLLGEHLGADRAFYYRAEWASDGWVHVVDHDVSWNFGVPARTGRRAQSEFGAALFAGLARGEPVVVADVRAVASLTPEQRANYEAVRLRSFVAVPLVKGGRYVAGVAACSATAREWSGTEVALVAEVAERTWSAAERARAEAALRESEARLAAVFEVLPVGVGVFDARGALLLSNQEMRRSMPTGTMPSRDEARRSRWRARHPDGRPVEPQDFPGARALRGERVVPGQEMLHAYDDGRAAWTSVSAVPLRAGDGRVTGTAIVVAGIDALKRGAEALRASEERFRGFAENSADVLWIADRTGTRLEYLSPAFELTFGEGRGQVMADLGRWAELVHPDDRERALSFMPRAVAGEVAIAHYRVVRPADGRIVFLRDTGFPIRDATGAVARVAGIVQDITDLERAAERQRVLVAELQHRTRNLLGVVRNVARSSIPPSPGLDEYDARLAALGRVQGFLSRSSLYAVPLADLVRAELVAAGVGASDRVTVGGPPVALPGEGVQVVALALHELATNAVKYGAIAQTSGRLSVTWRVEAVDGAGQRLVIDWQESGVAMPGGGGPPARRGYGTELITEALPYQLDAETALEFGHDGVRCRIALPVGAFSGSMQEAHA